ncbi:hypothetical protein F5Y10DRAFT_171928 [Nemania abortiva]|nr:hypothetical protein F5Y10DRAFT_171928 [Nemania abortiva]
MLASLTSTRNKISLAKFLYPQDLKQPLSRDCLSVRYVKTLDLNYVITVYRTHVIYNKQRPLTRTDRLIAFSCALYLIVIAPIRSGSGVCDPLKHCTSPSRTRYGLPILGFANVSNGWFGFVYILALGIPTLAILG